MNQESRIKGHFLQSHEWGEFQKFLGRKVWRGGDALLTKMPLLVGKSYLYSAGEIGIKNYESIIPNVLKAAKEIAKEENVIFFKFEPMSSDAGIAGELERAGCKKSVKAIQPQQTIILDIVKSEEELLAGMHQKTRYNIGLAGKKESRIRNHGSPIEESVLDAFWDLLHKTAAKDDFFPHPKEYYKKLLELPIASLFVVEHQGKIIAANIVILHGGRATYLHGASCYEYRNLMAPYLLHWETIRYAKEHGISEYDLWGIDEVKWPGLTRFKRGFGGKEVEYAGSYDYVFQPMWYKLYMLRGALRNFSRKLGS